jgi:hypothetical protein
MGLNKLMIGIICFTQRLVNWLEAFGLKKHNAKDKEIPLAILKMSREVLLISYKVCLMEMVCQQLKI